MQINRLDHVNLRTNQLDTMIAWYEDVLGLHNGARPDFGFPGAWLYAGDAAVVHISQVEDDAGTGSEAALKLEHFALTASGSAAFEEQLNSHGVTFKKAGIASLGVTAFNIWDPDGNHIHVDFTDAG